MKRATRDSSLAPALPGALLPSGAICPIIPVVATALDKATSIQAKNPERILLRDIFFIVRPITILSAANKHLTKPGGSPTECRRIIDDHSVLLEEQNLIVDDQKVIVE